MSDTAGEKGRVKRIRQRRTVTIRRDDHLGDPIGIIFLDPESADHDSLVARLRDYLGARVRILKAELNSARADVEYDERIQDAKADRDRGEEVAREEIGRASCRERVYLCV